MSSKSSRTACVLRYSPRASFFDIVVRSMGRRITYLFEHTKEKGEARRIRGHVRRRDRGAWLDEGQTGSSDGPATPISLIRPYLKVGGRDLLRDGLREEVHEVLGRQHLQQPAQRLRAAAGAEELPVDADGRWVGFRVEWVGGRGHRTLCVCLTWRAGGCRPGRPGRTPRARAARTARAPTGGSRSGRT
jgi:hypothetical protein